ncbi:MAG: lamin tail domain-containing protein [Minicystis sp.]
MSAAASICAGCTPVESSVVVNEINTQVGGKIELAGTISSTNAAVDLSGWTLRRADGGLAFAFTSGATLAPGQHLVLTRTTDQLFELGKSDTVILEDETGLLLDQVTYGSGDADVSFCRLPDAEGTPALCARATFGEVNQP